MKKRKIIEGVRVVAIGHKGMCIGKTQEGEAVLVKGAVPGDIIDLQVRKRRNKMKWGVPEKFIEYSEHRVDPVCAHFEHCGGCSWQNLSYDEQLRQKESWVHNTIQRVGGIKEAEFKSIIGGERQLYYRNKMVYSFSRRRWMTPEEIRSDVRIEESGLGFYAGGTFDKVIDLKECHLQIEPSNAIRNRVRVWAEENNFSFYDAKSHVGDLRNLIIKTSRSGEVMLTLVTGVRKEEIIDSFKNEILANFENVTSITWMVNEKWNDSLHDIEFSVEYGPGFITETLDGVDFRIGPKSFFQTNPYQAEHLFRAVKEMADFQPGDHVYDLYCGVGTIGLYMSKYVEKIVGVEEVKEAIDDAIINAELNSIENAHFEVGDVKLLVNEQFIGQHGKPDVVITDPPRVGMHEDVVKTLIQNPMSKIIYVSCNPATQARDLQRLSEKYNVETIQPVDMFPQTNHVESIALLKMRK